MTLVEDNHCIFLFFSLFYLNIYIIARSVLGLVVWEGRDGMVIIDNGTYLVRSINAKIISKITVK